MPRRSRWFELCLAAAFMVVHLVAPVVIGERYPFTIYLVYDGNPPGLGMGITPTETLHPYSQPCQQQEVTDHVRSIMKRDGITGPITITRRHLFHQDHKISDETDQWEVSIDGPGQPTTGDQPAEPAQQ